MKFKKIIPHIVIVLCMISLLTLAIVIFSGCTTLDSVSKTMNSYSLDIDYNSSLQTLKCDEEIVYTNNTDVQLNYLAFHLYPNAFREESKASTVSLANQHKAYPNGLNYGNIEINSVLVLNSTATYCDTIQIAQPTYSEIDNYIKNTNPTAPQYFIGGEDENILYILFPNSLYPDEKIELNISFNVKIPNVNHRFGYGDNTVNLANFYPIACVFDGGEFDTSLYSSNGDPFYSDMSNYQVSISAPLDFIIANTGYITNKTEVIIQEKGLQKNEGSNENVEIDVSTNKTKYFLEAKAVRDFAIVLSKEFNVITNTFNNTEIKYYYFSDVNPTLSLETAVKSVQTFNEIIGEYPYSTLSVVEANFLHGGMEYPNLVYISNEIADEKTYNQVIIHEIAHQWWYNLVGNSEVSYAWLDEGLTEYTTALFYELHPEYEVSVKEIIKNAYNGYSLFIEVYSQVNGSVDTTMNRDLDEFNNDQEYLYVAYVKGMLLFDSLREIMGYKDFIKCLQNYFSKYKYQNVKPADLISSFENTSGIDLENYFNAWIDGKIILLK